MAKTTKPKSTFFKAYISQFLFKMHSRCRVFSQKWSDLLRWLCFKAPYKSDLGKKQFYAKLPAQYSTEAQVLRYTVSRHTYIKLIEQNIVFDCGHVLIMRISIFMLHLNFKVHNMIY
jgi:hypothetical protein